MGASGTRVPAQTLRVLVDTNVVLDQLLQREPWYTQAQPFWQARDAGRIVAYLASSAITDIYYISRRQVGNDEARSAVARCLREFGLVAVYRGMLEAALAMAGSDFEDNLQIACAQFARLDGIATRNIRDFRHSPILAAEPAALAALLAP